jgi:peroxiredoxin family protein
VAASRTGESDEEKRAIVGNGEGTEAAKGEAVTSEMLHEIVARLAALEDAVKAQATDDRLSMVVFSGSLDRQIAAFVLATGAAASGMQVDMFFTFWGLSALRDPKKKPSNQDTLSRAFGWMLPRGFGDLPLSTMNLGGLGPWLIRRVMRKKSFASIDDMLAICSDLGVRVWACDMSREMLGISTDELIDYPHLGHCGVAHFISQASRGRVAMFL